MADTAARLSLFVRRYEVARFTISVTGIDMTGVAMAMQVRLQRGTPGTPLIALGTVTTAAAEGLKLDSVRMVDGVPVSVITGRINQSTMSDAAKVPYAGELGADTVLAYAMQWTLGGDARTRIEGDLIVRDTAFGSDNAPVNRPIGYSGTSYAGGAVGALQFGDQIIAVSIDGVDIAGQYAQTAKDAAAAATGALPIISATRAIGINDLANRLGGGPALYISRTFAYRRAAAATPGAVTIANAEAAELPGYAKILLPDRTAEQAVIYRGDTNTVEVIAYDAALPATPIVDVLATVWGSGVHSRYEWRDWDLLTVANQCWYGRTMTDMPVLFQAPGAFRTETDVNLLALGLTQSYAPGAGLAAYAGDVFPPESRGKALMIAGVMTSDTGSFDVTCSVYFYDADGAQVGTFNPPLARSISANVRRYQGRATIPARAVSYLIGMNGVNGTRLGVTGVQHAILPDARPLAFLDPADFPAPASHRGTIILLTIGQSNGTGAGGAGIQQTVDRQDPRVLQQITSALGPELATGAAWRNFAAMTVTVDAAGTLLTTSGVASNPAAVATVNGLTANAKHRVLMRVECLSNVQALIRDNPSTTGKVQYPSTPSARWFDFDITPTGTSTDLALIGNGSNLPAGTQWRISGLSVRRYNGAGTAVVPATEPMRWPGYDADYGAYGTSPAFHMARRLVERDASLQRVVILPCNQPGQGLTTGPWAAPNGSLYQNAVTQLTAALARYPGARVVGYIANGEADAIAGTTQAAFVAAETAVIAGLRAVKGAENAEFVQVSMVPEWIADPAAPAGNTRAAIDAAHRQLVQQVKGLHFVNGVLGQALPASGTDNLIHYSQQGERINGRNAAAAVRP